MNENYRFNYFDYTSILPNDVNSAYKYVEQINYLENQIIEICKKLNLSQQEFQSAIVSIVSQIDTIIKNTTSEFARVDSEISSEITRVEGEIDNVVKNIDQRVDVVFTQMVASGELEVLINKTLLASKVDVASPKSNDIDVTRIFSRNIEDYSKYVKPPLGITYPHAQGYCNIDGNSIMIAFARPDNVECRLIEFALTSGNVLRETILPLGHGNSLTYNPSKKIMYCVNLRDGTTPVNTITIINYTSLTITSRFTTQNPMGAIAYDRVTDKLYGQSKDKVYEIDVNNNYEETFKFFIPNWVRNCVPQSFCVKNDVFATITFEPSNIILCDINGKSLMLYNIPMRANNRYTIGEPEDIEFDPNSYSKLNFTSVVNSAIGIMSKRVQLHGIDFRYNSQINKKELQNGNYFTADATVYVDSSNTNPNPDGSQSNPFVQINDAIELLNSPSLKGNLFIVVKARDIYEFITIHSAKRVVIKSEVETEKVRIAGGVIRGSNVSIYNCTFIKILTTYTAPLTLSDGIYYLDGCEFSGDVGVLNKRQLDIESGGFCTLHNTIVGISQETGVICYAGTRLQILGSYSGSSVSDAPYITLRAGSELLCAPTSNVRGFISKESKSAIVTPEYFPILDSSTDYYFGQITLSAYIRKHITKLFQSYNYICFDTYVWDKSYVSKHCLRDGKKDWSIIDGFLGSAYEVAERNMFLNLSTSGFLTITKNTKVAIVGDSAGNNLRMTKVEKTDTTKDTSFISVRRVWFE